MPRSIKLSRNLTSDIHNMCQHFISNRESNDAYTISQDYEELRDMTHYNDRFKLTVILEDVVPESKDLILNLLVKEILCMVDDDEDDTDMMNAFYQYLSNTYTWDGEQDPHSSYLLKAVTVEALEYCVQWVIDRRDEILF